MQKSREEIDAMSPAERKAYDHQQSQVVFGTDFKKDRKGNPLEVGFGAPGHETENHFRAIGKNEGPEAEKAAREAAKQRKAKAS